MTDTSMGMVNDLESTTLDKALTEKPAPKEIILTGCQKDAAGEISDWLKNPHQPIAILDGGGGTGKTFLAALIQAQNRNHTFLFTAPSNKAVGVLQKSLPANTKVKTTFSALGLRPNTSREEGGLLQSVNYATRIKNVNVLGVDEGSFVDSCSDDPTESGRDTAQEDWGLAEFIEQAAEDVGCKILYMADEMQLPPPRGDAGISPIFRKGYPVFSLRETVRNDGAILKYNMALRHEIDKLENGAAYRAELIALQKRINGYTPEMLAEREGFLLDEENKRLEELKLLTKPVLIPSPKDFGLPLLSAFGKKEVLENMGRFLDGSLKYIAFRNVTVDRINTLVRKARWGASVAPLCVGDIVTFTNPVFDLEKFYDIESPLRDPVEWSKAKNFSILASIDSTATVLSITEIVKWGVLFYEAEIKIDGGANTTTLFLPPHSLPDFKSLVGKLVMMARTARNSQAAWRVKNHFEKCVMPIKFGYAMTSHRSQGSTFPAVVVNAKDIHSCGNDKLTQHKSHYVASSRPTTELITVWG